MSNAIRISLSLCVLIFITVNIKAENMNYGLIGENFYKGTLSNDLTYYVGRNRTEDGKINFYLIERAGSIVETPEERGLAHLLEHMAFNGTIHFPGSSLIEYLRTKGINFGRELNASTSFDKTVFRIENVPSQGENIDSCLLILYDWANAIQLSDEGIEKERGIIIEEWRSTDNEQKRIRNQISQQLLPCDHPYLTNTPIGDIEVIKNFPPEKLREFYKKWYRPDQQAIIVIGDIDPEDIIVKIKNLWKDINKPEYEVKYPSVDLPDNDSLLTAIALDPQIKSSSLDIQFRLPLTSEVEGPKKDSGKDEYIKQMISTLFASRLKNISRDEDLNLQGFGVYMGNYTAVALYPAFTIGASFRGRDWEGIMKTLVYELKRIYELGFNADEYEKIKNQILNSEGAESNNYFSNSVLSTLCMDNFLTGKEINAKKDINKDYKYYATTTGIGEINRGIKNIINPAGHNTVVIIRANDKALEMLPVATELKENYYQNWKAEVKPYVAQQKIIKQAGNDSKDLMADYPSSGSVIDEFFDESHGWTILHLSNESKVYLKKTNNEDRRILLSAVSQGGFSILKPEDYKDYSVMNSLSMFGGAGNLSARELSNFLAKKNINYSMGVDVLTEQFNGSSTAENLEDLFRLLYLRFTEIGLNRDLFNKWKEDFKIILENQRDSEEKSITDSISGWLYEGIDYIGKRGFVNNVEDIDYEKSISLFKDRYANASDFTFIIVGDFEIDKLKPLIERYLATLPSEPGKKEQYNILYQPSPREGKHKIRVRAQRENSATNVNHLVYFQLENTLKNRLILNIYNEILGDRLLKEIRENRGGTYNVRVQGSINRVPANLLSLSIDFDTNDENAELLLNAVEEVIEMLKENIDDKDIPIYKRKLKEDFQKDYNKNFFQMEILKDHILYSSEEFFDYENILDSITIMDLQDISEKIGHSPTVLDVIIDAL